MTPNLFGPRSGATISPCGRYRYELWRRWDPSRPQLVWVMLNPSTADALEDDPTVRRCIGFAKAWRYGGIDVVNLYAYRATDPRELGRVDDPVGPDNDAHIASATAAATVVAAWGKLKPSQFERAGRVVGLTLANSGRLPFVLGTTKDGQPRHPLYMPKSSRLAPMVVTAPVVAMSETA